MIIKIEKDKNKKKMQFSKKITIYLILVITITWALGIYVYWDKEEFFNYLLEYVQGIFIAILPYTMISTADRLVYWQEAKNKGEK